MTNDEIYVMKLKLQAYNANVRRFEQEKLKYEEILYNMEGVHAVSWGKSADGRVYRTSPGSLLCCPKKTVRQRN